MDIDHACIYTARSSTSQKLRSSCDRCSSSKVKCGQERPACQRCTSAGVSCNYSASRRMGKPMAGNRNSTFASRAKSSRKTTLPSPRSSVRSYPGLTDRRTEANTNDKTADAEMDLANVTHSADEPWMDLSYLSSDSSTSLTRAADSVGSDIADMSQLNGFMNSSESMTNFQWGDMALYDSMIPSLDYQVGDNPLSIHNHGLLEQSSDPSAMSASSASRALHDSNSSAAAARSNETRLTCSTLASSVLNSLSVYTTFCTTKEDPNVLLKVDERLATARHAIIAFHKLLECACSRNAQNALSLGIILQKATYCYTAVIEVAARLDQAATTLANCDVSMEAPILIGAYQIDAEDENRLRMQVVLSELRRVSKAIEAFAARFCADPDMEKGSQLDAGLVASSDNDPGKAVYRIIEQFLRSQLQKSICDVTEILNQP